MDSLYQIIVINDKVGEYGVEKIGTNFIVARGHLSHCEEILALIDPIIAPSNPGLLTRLFKYLNIL